MATDRLSIEKKKTSLLYPKKKYIYSAKYGENKTLWKLYTFVLFIYINMSTNTAAMILFGSQRSAYTSQQTRVKKIQEIVLAIERQFLASVRDRTTQPQSIDAKEWKDHEEIKRKLSRAKLQLADEVKLLQWLRKRHNRAVLNCKANIRYLVF